MKKVKVFCFLVIMIFFLFTFSCSKESTSSDTESPTVMITYPPDNSDISVGTIVNIVAEADDNKEIDFVQFYIDGVSVLEDSSEPYGYSWDTTGLNGSHTIYAKAKDTSENITTSELITVAIFGEAPNPPSNPNPVNGVSDLSIDTILSWTCSDPNGDELTYDVYFGVSSSPPLINSNHTSMNYDPGTLDNGTTYYWKIVASDGLDETEGPVWEFTTGLYGTVTDIDGNEYQTLIIGDQEWMIENLKVTHYRNGNPIPNVTDNSTWAGLSTEAYCVYDNDPSNTDIYGNLYNWYAIDDPRGLTPEGWHVPTDEEIMELEMYLGMSYTEAHAEGWRGTNEGSKLAGSADLWSDGALDNDPEFDSSGFSFLPGGYRYYYSGTFNDLSFNGFFWSSTESGSYAWIRRLYCSYANVSRGSHYKWNGFSVRCVRD
ncbi:MAG: FISUMP domain-containing protein [Candidatus Tenebribacter burtonii]|nr:FISUMP domain-containing protein [Candidatus Tenebribacter burtonii]